MLFAVDGHSRPSPRAVVRLTLHLVAAAVTIIKINVTFAAAAVTMRKSM